MMWAGIALSLGVWWLVAIVVLAYWLYVERVMLAEEAFLAEHFPREFSRWASRTRAFVPQPSKWVASSGRIQFKRLSSEHNGLLTIGLAMPLLQYLSNALGEGLSWHAWSARHGGWMALIATTGTISVLCILLRRLPPASTAAPASDVRPFQG